MPGAFHNVCVGDDVALRVYEDTRPSAALGRDNAADFAVTAYDGIESGRVYLHNRWTYTLGERLKRAIEGDKIIRRTSGRGRRRLRSDTCGT
jgi:hypothetical protein